MFAVYILLVIYYEFVNSKDLGQTNLDRSLTVVALHEAGVPVILMVST